MTCYKCGKELQPGDISGECVMPCQPAAPVVADVPLQHVIALNIRLNPKAIGADPKAFENCLGSFLRELERITSATGLGKFCKKQNEP